MNEYTEQDLAIIFGEEPAESNTTDSDDLDTDISDQSDYLDFNSIDDEQETETAEDEEDFEAMLAEDEEPAEETNFDDLPENLVIKYGDKSLSRKDVSRLIAKNEELNQAYEGLSGASRDFEANAAYFQERVVAVQTEADREIAAIKRQINDPYITNTKRGELYSALTNAEQRKSIIEQEAKAFTAKAEQVKVKEIEQRVHHMNHVMAQNHKDWGDMQNDIGQYIAQSGMPKQDLMNALSPQFAEIVLKAFKYDKAMKNAMDKVNKPVQKQRPVAKATPANRKQKVESDAVSRFKKGIAKDSDLSIVYDFLEK